MGAKYFSIVAAAFCLAFFAAYNGRAEQASRVLDPVVIKGMLLGPIKGEALDNLSLYAIKGSDFGPIPFQIDEVAECKARGCGYQETYVVEGGELKCKTEEPGLDRNDELVFMANDAGGQVLARDWPRDAKAGIEIKVTDPLTGDRKYAYLFVFNGAAPRSNIDYVQYDPGLDLVKSAYYEMGFAEFPPITLDRLSIPASNKGRGQDILDSLKIRGDIILLNVFTHVLDNNDYAGEIIGYKDGAVRVIRSSAAIAEVWPFTQIKKIFVSKHYPQWSQYDLFFNLPVASGKLDLALELNDQARGMTFYSQKNISGVTVDGEMSQAEKTLDYGSGEWLAVAGEQGNILVRMILPDASTAYPDLYYHDDAQKSDPPENEPGQVGKMGVTLTPLNKLNTSNEPLTMVFYFPQDFRPGMEKDYFKVNDSPLEVQVDTNIALVTKKPSPLLPDNRPELMRPAPAFEAKTFEESRERGMLYFVTLDPNLGYGGGVAYMDRDFRKTGMKADIGVSITHRLYQSYYLNMRQIPGMPWIDNTQVNVSFDNHPNRYYYGEGNESEMDELTVYKRDDFYIQVLAEKYFAGHFGTGIMLEYHNVDVGHGEMVSGEYDSIEEHYGPDEDIIDDERWGPEVYGWGENNTNRIQLSALADYRDSEIYPTEGFYVKYFCDIVSPAFGADYFFLKYKFQGSVYLSPGFFNPETSYVRNPGPFGWKRKFAGPDKNRVLAFRLTIQDIEAEFKEFEGRDIIDVPFYELSYLGDSRLMRGYYEARRRGNDLIDLQAEFRWNMFKDKMGFFLFADAGRVFDDIWDDIEDDDAMYAENLLFTYGFGINVTIIPQYIQTITFGFSEEETALNYFFGWYTFEDFPRQLLKAKESAYW